MRKNCPIKWKKEFPKEFELKSSVISLFFISLESSLETYQYFFDCLDEAELERAKAFYFEKDRTQFVVLRGVLKGVLGRFLCTKIDEISITYNENGKPFLKDVFTQSSFRFNVSHSQDHALIALSLNHEVGVDLEKMDSLRKWPDILKKNFDESENKYVFSVSDEKERLQRFYQLWTLKEAIVKCEGKGLLTSLESIHLPIDQLNRDESFYQDLSLRYFQCPQSEYVGSLAVLGKNFSIDAYQINSQAFID